MKLKLLALVLALQCVWLLATTFNQERALRVGKVIMLETERVDPRDLLRGDYLILNYKISTVPSVVFLPALTGELSDGTKISVALAPHGQFYEAVRASLQPLTPADGEVVIQGRSGWVNRRGWWGGNLTNTTTVHVEYGLERFYVAEGTGNPRGKLTVQAAVPKSGRATIKEVFVDGQPYAEAMKAAEK